ncbi:MAG: hypothetical protein EOM92_17290 [Gammaproteobacteria bacterium]|nr:hypothetical protein [Gammaproteobacteria bacterium]
MSAHQTLLAEAVAQQAEHLVKTAAGLAPNQSWGVGRHESADQAFELYRALRHQLAWDYARDHHLTNPDGSRNWAQMMGVDYDEPIRYTQQPLASIKRLEEDPKPYPFVVEEETE